MVVAEQALLFGNGLTVEPLRLGQVTGCRQDRC